MPEVNTTVHDVTIHYKRKLTDEEILEGKMKQLKKEKAFIRKVLNYGTSKEVAHVRPVEGFERFYEVELVPKVFDKLKFYLECYIEARSTGDTAVVFVHFPRKFESEEAYKAFWVYDGNVIELVESNSIQLAKHIFEHLFQ